MLDPLTYIQFRNVMFHLKSCPMLFVAGGGREGRGWKVMIRVHISTMAEATALKFRELIVLMKTNV